MVKIPHKIRVSYIFYFHGVFFLNTSTATVKTRWCILGVRYIGSMIIGFLGKGGSGKSSVATQMALFLHMLGKEVLAIDADHNMDFAYNITGGCVPSDTPCLGNGLDAIRSMFGLREGDPCSKVFLEKPGGEQFSVNPVDPYTRSHSDNTAENLPTTP